MARASMLTLQIPSFVLILNVARYRGASEIFAFVR